MGRLTEEQRISEQQLTFLRTHAAHLPRQVIQLIDEVDFLRTRLRLAEAVVEAARQPLTHGDHCGFWMEEECGCSVHDIRAALAALDAERGEK